MRWLIAVCIFFPLTLWGADSLQHRHELGNNYAEKKQYDKAAEIWRETAELGYPASLYNLGQLHYFGLGVPKDLPRSFLLYKSAAELGESKAFFSLGYAHYAGKGTPQNYTEGLKWLTIAAEQENAAAQRLIGQAYYHGNGIAIDYQQAAAWYLRSAIGGDTSGQFMTGLMYQRGEGLTQNYYKAAEYFTLAAEAGDAKAQHNLGALYSEGQGVAKDLAEAKKWLSRSAEQGLAESQEALKDIDSMITTQNIQRLSVPYPDLPINIEAYVHDGKRGCIPEDLFEKVWKNQNLFPVGSIQAFSTPTDGIHYLRVMEDFDNKVLYFVGSKNDGLYCVLTRYDNARLDKDTKFELLVSTTKQKKMTKEECSFAQKYGTVCDNFDSMRSKLLAQGFNNVLRGTDKSRDYVALFSQEEKTYLLTTNHLTGATIITGFSNVGYRNILLEFVQQEAAALQKKLDAMEK